MNSRIAPLLIALIACAAIVGCTATVAPEATATIPAVSESMATSVVSGLPTETDTPRDGGPTAVSTPGGEDSEQEPTPTLEATGAFFLDIEAPSSDEVIVFTRMLDVKGRSTVDALVSVNDTIAEIDGDGRFSVPVELIEGPNIVEVVASDTDGGQFSEVLLVIYDPNGSV